MRMERINDRQVRCVITSEDLAERSLSLRELKYGSMETAKLFKEMLSAAYDEYGFNADNLPIMIEAVPMNRDELLIIISAVEDAEELDPHFARFAPQEDPGASFLQEPNAGTQGSSFLPTENESFVLSVGLVEFNSIDDAILFCKQVGDSFPGHTALYRTPGGPGYLMVILKPDEMSAHDFHTFLNSLMEYGDLREDGRILYAWLSEHDSPVMEEPLHILSGM